MVNLDFDIFCLIDHNFSSSFKIQIIVRFFSVNISRNSIKNEGNKQTKPLFLENISNNC